MAFAAAFARDGDCQARIKLIEGKVNGDPGEVQIISIKNVPCGFLKELFHH